MSTTNQTRNVEDLLTNMLVVAVALIDDGDRVLMQKRRAGTIHAGLWEFPGGKLEFGESPKQAAIREMREELGVEIDPEDLDALTFASEQYQSGQNVILLYTCRRWRGKPQCWDAEAIGWYQAVELAGLAKPSLDYPLAECVSELLERSA